MVEGKWNKTVRIAIIHSLTLNLGEDAKSKAIQT